MKKTEQYATRIKQLIEAIYRSNKKEILVISDENMYWKIGRQWGNFSEIERMLEEITKGIRENGIMKIDIQDTNAFSIREDIVQVSGNYEVIYVAGYGHRRLVYNIVATYYREQITYLQILEMGKYHSTSYRVKAVNEDYYKIAENEILYLEANHNHVVWNCINGKIVALDSLGNLEALLSERFVRIQRGYIVNKDYVKCIRRCEVVMENGDVLSIPTRKYIRIKEKLME